MMMAVVVVMLWLLPVLEQADAVGRWSGRMSKLVSPPLCWEWALHDRATAPADHQQQRELRLVQ